MSTVYNFIWINGATSATLEIGAAVDHVSATLQAVKEAVILYPSLFTPAVYVQESGGMLELLIASHEVLNENDVNAHLKISTGLDPEKSYDPRPLFASLQGPMFPIVLSEIHADKNRMLHTEHRFSGILAVDIVKLYDRFNHIYKISINPEAIPSHSPEGMLKLNTREAVAGLSDKAIVPKETMDVVINKFLKTASNPGTGAHVVPGGRCYGFKLDSTGKPNLAVVDPNEPVQTYHPLFVWISTKTAANIGHVSDIHLNARLELLHRSPARVVEDLDNPSPEIGSRLAVTNHSFSSILSQMQNDAEVDALVVGGDLHDHNLNAYAPGVLAAAVPTIPQIWQAVDLHDDTYVDRYPAGVDFLTLYTQMVHFCREGRKPVFGVSGNHDAYVKPFGISPRVLSSRTNVGIPADLNLTFYEALLCFGPSWGALKSTNNFDHTWWTWFYQLFGPFNDFVVRLPNQNIVGLGWGSQEDVVTDDSEQGWGHLPRSDDALTDAQLAMVTLAAAQKPVLLVSHFTVQSFFDERAMGGRGTTARALGSLSEALDNSNLGSFENNRKEFIALIKAQSSDSAKPGIEFAIAGHSHRRGTYQITGVDPKKKDVFTTSMHDTRTVGGAVAGFSMRPVIAVSDSAGPMPRLNIVDEFDQWGSDVSSGTVAKFGASGKLESLRIVQAKKPPKPRVAVALDYLDVARENLFTDPIRTRPVSDAAESAARSAATPAQIYIVSVPFSRGRFTRNGMKAVSCTLHGAVEADGGEIEWLKIELIPADPDQNAIGLVWTVAALSTPAFYRWATAAVERFIGFTFTSNDDFLNEHYDWDDSWYFEVNVKRLHARNAGVYYEIQRPSRTAQDGYTISHFQEIPDFDWRQKNLGKYSG